MNDQSTDPWIKLADRLDALRVFPRLIIIGYSLFVAWAWLYVVNWFMAYDWAGVDNQAVALALAAFPAAILTVLTGVLGKLMDNYVRTGRKPGGGE